MEQAPQYLGMFAFVAVVASCSLRRFPRSQPRGCLNGGVGKMQVVSACEPSDVLGTGSSSPVFDRNQRRGSALASRANGQIQVKVKGRKPATKSACCRPSMPEGW